MLCPQINPTIELTSSMSPGVRILMLADDVTYASNYVCLQHAAIKCVSESRRDMPRQVALRHSRALSRPVISTVTGFW